VLVVLVCFGWIPVLVIAVARGRRPRTRYGRELRAAERGHHRRRGQRGGDITVSLDTRPAGLDKLEP
jgi:hypothetical protein